MGKIPKIIHQIWLWKNKFPEKFSIFQKTWIKCYPDWNLQVWNEGNIHDLQNVNQSDLNKLNNYSEKSDYLRYIILLEKGWIYIDTDMECFRSIENQIQDIDFFICKDTDWVLNTAIIGSAPKHQLLNNLVNSFHSRITDTEKWSQYSSNERIGPAYVENFIQKNKYFDKIKIFPAEYFYPIHWKYFSWGKMHIKKYDFSKSYWMHHYEASWISPLFKLRKKILNLPWMWKVYYFIKPFLNAIRGKSF